MEQFKASDEDWRQIKIRAKNYSSAEVSRAVLELRDRVAALEAERVAPVQVPSTAAPTPPAAAPSDEELWEVQLKARRRAQPDAARKCVMMDQAEAAHRALYDHGFQHGLAAGRAEQGSSSQGILDDSTPEPEPSDFQTLHGIALDMVDSLRPIVIPEILNVLRRAIREPMAEQQAAAEPTHPQYFSSHHAIAGEIWGTLPDAPEPNQAPAEEAGLVEEVLDAMGEGTEVEARAAIRAVARWLRSEGNCGSATYLEWEANR
jgi:uncharacterized protein (DUF2267 family)